jgi:hypothetical protein
VKKHKIIIVGGSNARGCTFGIKYNLEDDFEFQGFLDPGTGVDFITNSAKVDIEHLKKQDVTVVWGGSKDVGKNLTKNEIKCIQNFVKTNSHTNIILVDVQHRHDLDKISCINREVDICNRKLWKHEIF